MNMLNKLFSSHKSLNVDLYFLGENNKPSIAKIEILQEAFPAPPHDPPTLRDWSGTQFLHDKIQRLCSSDSSSPST